MKINMEFDLSSVQGMFDELWEKAGSLAAAGLYKGAGVVADALTEEINNIQTEPFRYATSDDPRLPSPEEKAMLLSAAHGVAHFRGSGSEIETSIGMSNAGYMTFGHAKAFGRMKYGRHAGERGIAVPLLARAISSGTSFRRKQPFLRRYISKSKGRAMDTLARTIDEGLQSISDAHQ